MLTKNNNKMSIMSFFFGNFAQALQAISLWKRSFQQIFAKLVMDKCPFVFPVNIRLNLLFAPFYGSGSADCS